MAEEVDTMAAIAEQICDRFQIGIEPRPLQSHELVVGGKYYYAQGRMGEAVWSFKEVVVTKITELGAAQEDENRVFVPGAKCYFTYQPKEYARYHKISEISDKFVNNNAWWFSNCRGAVEVFFAPQLACGVW